MGRASLILVMSFSIMLLMIGSNISKVSSAAMENYIFYYNAQMAHSIAGSGMNLASRALYENSAWRVGFSNKEFNGGVFTCIIKDEGTNLIRVTSTGTFQNTRRVVSCLLQPSSFSRFGYYSSVEGLIWWITGDTVWGPIHTQDNLRVAGTPVFMQKATSLKNIIYNTSAKVDKPVFKGGYDSGVSVTMPANLNPLATAALSGKRFSGPDSVYIEFLSNGRVRWKQGVSTAWSEEALSTFTPNGVIYVSGTNTHVSGVLNGRVTLATVGTTGNGKQGNIRIDDNLTYATNPLTGTSTDMLGLVAENSVIISDNVATSGKNISIHASIFSRTGGFTAENYATRGIEGTIHLLGGIQNNVRQAVGTFYAGNPPQIASGYLKNYRYDDRLMRDAPAYFPTTGNFEVVSWFE
jgi:hypothetical protein